MRTKTMTRACALLPALVLALAGLAGAQSIDIRSSTGGARTGAISTTGSDCATSTACIGFRVDGIPGWGIYLDVGTSGTFVFEVTQDDPSEYTSTTAHWTAIDDLEGDGTATADGAYYFSNTGARWFRVRASAISGAATFSAARGFGVASGAAGGVGGGGDVDSNGEHIATEATLVAAAASLTSIAQDIDDLVTNKIAPDAVHGNAVIGTGPGVQCEAKDIDGGALPSVVTEGQSARVACVLNGAPIVVLANEAGTVDIGAAIAAAIGATGSGVPASANYTGVNVAGNSRGLTAVNPSGSIYAAQMDLASLGGATISATNPLPVVFPGTLVSGVISSAMTSTTSTSLVGGTASNYLYIGSCVASNASTTVSTDILLQDGSGGTTLWVLPAPAAAVATTGGGGATHTFNPPLKVPTSGNALYAANVTTGSSTKVSCNGFRSTVSY